MDKKSKLAFDKDELIRRGFNEDQIKEIKQGISSNVDVSVYMYPHFMPIQMRQIRLGLQDNLPVHWYANFSYDWFQMEEIRKGLKLNLDVEKYASSDIPYEKMREIRKGLEENIDLTEYIKYSAKMMRVIRKSIMSKIDIMPYIDEGYDTLQLSYIRESLEKKINIEPYISKELRGTAIREIMLGLEDGLDVKQYAKPEYSWQQMREIRIGIKNRVDVSQYTSTYYNWQQMREIRFGLEMGLDVNSYKSYMYTAKEMKKRREGLNTVTTGYYRFENKTKVVEDIEVKICSNEMEAQAKIVNGSESYTREEIVRDLAEYGIIEGLDYKAIERMIKYKGNDEFVVVAKGTEVINGDDGWYEFFIDIDNKKQPKMLPDGSVDYQNTEWYQTVKKRDKLAYYHSAKQGVNGTTVTGKTIVAKKGKEKGVLTLEGCELLKDNKTYVASKDGKVELKNNKLIVTDTFEFEDITLATGNIDFDGNVYIKGNVLSGTTIKATGDVVVCGFVESATIIAGGNIEIKLGVNAPEKGYIEAKGSIAGKYFENAVIRAGDDVRANYILNSEVYTLGKIIINGSKGTITGGTSYARLGIYSNNIGNNVNVKTKISIGVNEEMLDKLQILVKNIRDAKKEINMLQHAFEEFNKKYTPEERNLKDIYIKIQKSLITYKLRLKKFLLEKEEMEQEIEQARKSKIVVKGTLYEGIIVEIENNLWSSTNLKNVCIDKKYRNIEISSAK